MCPPYMISPNRYLRSSHGTFITGIQVTAYPVPSSYILIKTPPPPERWPPGSCRGRSPIWSGLQRWTDTSCSNPVAQISSFQPHRRESSTERRWWSWTPAHECTAPECPVDRQTPELWTVNYNKLSISNQTYPDLDWSIDLYCMKSRKSHLVKVIQSSM